MSTKENYELVAKFIRDFKTRGDYTADGLIAVIAELIAKTAEISSHVLCDDGRITDIASLQSIIKALDLCREDLIEILTKHHKGLH